VEVIVIDGGNRSARKEPSQIWEIKKKYISKNTRKISTMRVRRFVPCPVKPEKQRL
jgi:hypothetical protein